MSRSISLGLLGVSLAAFSGCSASHRAKGSPSHPPSETVTVSASPAPPASSAPRARTTEPSSAIDSYESRLLGAIRAAAPRVRRVRVSGQGPLVTAIESLRRTELEIAGEVDPMDQEAVRLVVAAAPAEARASLRSPDRRTVVVWTDGERNHRPSFPGVHVSTPIANESGRPKLFEHIVVVEEAPALAARLAGAGLWPSTPALETLRIHRDGTRDVRVLGYLNAYMNEHQDRLSLASDAYASVQLSSSSEIESSLRAFAKGAQGKTTGPQRSLSEELRAKTMVDAVGSCGFRTWVSGAAVALVGRARMTVSGNDFRLVIEVERLETKISVDTWLALAPRYKRALAAVTRAIAKRGSVAATDVLPLALVHDEIKATYGAAASLLEIDDVLRTLRNAFEQGSPTAALEALEMRCMRTEEEQRLYEALMALGRPT